VQAPRIILAFLPSFCQKLSKLLKCEEVLTKTILHSFLRHGVANLTHYAATSAFCTNSLRCRRCYKPTSHCDKSCDRIDLLEMLRRHRKFHPALRRLAN